MKTSSVLVSRCDDVREPCRAQLTTKASSRSRKAAEVFVRVPASLHPKRQAGATALAAIAAGKFLSRIFVS
jgi:hypothetical protein